jgi:hypothetical protein
MRLRQTWGWLALGSAFAVGLAGCGTPGPPQPPSLHLPDRVTDLSAERNGAQTSLSWTMPKKNTDKLNLKDPIAVRVCREEGSSPCADAGTLTLAPGADATWSETLPAALDAGAPRTLTYFVELKNKKGRSAGLSNPAIVLAGAPPAPVAGLKIEMRKTGAVVHWTPDEGTADVRLHRKLLTPPTTKPKEGLTAPPPEPLEQSLLVEDAHEGRALDKTVRFGETYEYRAQRVSRVTVNGKTLELAGELSAPMQIEAKDIFPPAPPTGLVSVPTPGRAGAAPAIDLSWEPDAEPDLAGYIVYRREGDGQWLRISPMAPVIGPGFHDAHVEPGHTYRYAVTAIDQGGHESARSAEIEETAPSE